MLALLQRAEKFLPCAEEAYRIRRTTRLFGGDRPISLLNSQGAKMLRLADTSIRLYRKKDGKASLRLRSYLMVQTNVGFRLSAYLKTISCHLTLPSGEVIELTDISYSDSCSYCLETMI